MDFEEDFHVGCLGLVPYEDGVLYVREGKPGAEGKWNLPGGSKKEGESLRECMEREINEETSLEASAEQLLGVYILEAPTYDQTIAAYVWECERENGVPTAPQEDTVTDVDYFNLDDLDDVDLRHEGLRKVTNDYLEQDYPESRDPIDLRNT